MIKPIYIPEVLTNPCLPDQVKSMADSHGTCALTKYDIVVSYLEGDELCRATPICDVASWKIIDNQWLYLTRVDYTRAQIDFVHIVSVIEINPVGNY